MYRFVLWLVPTVEKFPRRQKFLLGDRLQATALDVLERLVEATYTRDRRRHLAAANLGIEKLRFLCRLAKDLGHKPVHLYYPGDDLFTPFERRRGLPIGNLTSQLFANVYLDRFDHFVTEVLRAPYLRYVDDFALFADDPARLEAWRGRLAAFLARRRLSLHPEKTHVASTSAPATFLGFELRPDGRRRLPEANVRRFRNRLRGFRDRWRAGTVTREEVEQRVRAWVAHAAHADTWRLRRAIFRDGWFAPRGQPVPGA